MDAVRWIKEHVGVILVALLLFVLSPVLNDIVPDPRLSALTKVILITANLGLAAIAAVTDVNRLRAHRRLERIRSDLLNQQEQKLVKLGERGATLQRSLERTTELIANLRAFIDNDDNALDEANRAARRQEAVKTCLKELCDVLVTDSRPPIDDPLKAIYFKATFFEYDRGLGESGKLVRKYWHYPATMAPRTDSWDIKADPNCAAVVAFATRQEVVLPNVQEAFMDGKCWKDGRAGQHAEYAQSSMLCVPIWREASQSVNSSPVRGVLTVDTNQIGYFHEGEAGRAARAIIFGPFLGLIRFAYLLTDGRLSGVEPVRHA